MDHVDVELSQFRTEIHVWFLYFVVAGFAIETNRIIMLVGVATILDHETEIDGETLVTCLRSHRCSLSGRCFAKFRRKTDWALVYFGRDLKLWHAFDKAMHLTRGGSLYVPGVGAIAFAGLIGLTLGQHIAWGNLSVYQDDRAPGRTLETLGCRRTKWDDEK